jgi:TolA-binding protein
VVHSTGAHTIYRALATAVVTATIVTGAGFFGWLLREDRDNIKREAHEAYTLAQQHTARLVILESKVDEVGERVDELKNQQGTIIKNQELILKQLVEIRQHQHP